MAEVSRHALWQATCNERHYWHSRELIDQARAAGVPLVEWPGLQVEVKTTITRLVNQARRLSIIGMRDDDWVLAKELRAQSMNRCKELLLAYEEVDAAIEARKAEARRARRQAVWDERVAGLRAEQAEQQARARARRRPA